MLVDLGDTEANDAVGVESEIRLCDGRLVEVLFYHRLEFRPGNNVGLRSSHACISKQNTGARLVRIFAGAAVVLAQGRFTTLDVIVVLHETLR